MREVEVQYCKSQANESKRIKLSECRKEPDIGECQGPNLMSLSDDVLLIILSFLQPPDLLSLSQCCRRFEAITKDRTLWENVDFKSHILSLINLKKYLRFFQPGTKHITTYGPAYSNKQTQYPSMSKSFLRGVAKNAPNLKTLILENHIIDSTKVLLEDFPSSLQHLGLRKCIMNNIASDKSYFYKIDKTLPKLKVLDLTDSEWFVPHSLLALSKSQTLEELNLSGCDVSDCLPYASLAANFGFCALKVLDLRCTHVSDTEVSCFNRTQTLRELYLGASGEEESSSEVTDFSITTFGGGGRGGGRSVTDQVIIMEVGSEPRPACNIETLVLRGYPQITDLTLHHTANSLKSLSYIDVTHSGVSHQGILHFKKQRPEVTIVSHHHTT